MVDSVTTKLLQIYCCVRIELIFKTGRHLTKLWVKEVDCLRHTKHQSTFLLKDEELASVLVIQCTAALVCRNCL